MSENSYVPMGPSTIESWLLAEEITHRVANEYTAAIGVLSNAASRCSNVDVRTALGLAVERLLAHADVHRALQPPPVGFTDLSLYLRGLCRAITRAGLAERKIHLTFVEEAVESDAYVCWRVGMIVAELVTNAARHGLRQRSGRIVVELSAPAGAVLCVVRDDGTSSNPQPGRGTRITKALTHELGGRIDWHFGAGGTTVSLCFPRDRPSARLEA